MSLPHASKPSRIRIPLQTLVIGLALFVIALGSMLLAFGWLEFSLGLVLATPVVVFLCALPTSALVDGWRTSLAMAAIITLGATLPLCLAATGYDGFGGASVQLVLLCLAVALCAIECPRLAARAGVHPAQSGAMLLLVGLTWLTMPVWMSPHFSESWGAWVIDHLLAYQPLIALNGAYHALGDWSHQPLAYTWLTSLGQDVPFALPPSAWRCVIGHAALALLPLVINSLIPTPQKTPDPTL